MQPPVFAGQYGFCRARKAGLRTMRNEKTKAATEADEDEKGVDSIHTPGGTWPPGLVTSDDDLVHPRLRHDVHVLGPAEAVEDGVSLIDPIVEAAQDHRGVLDVEHVAEVGEDSQHPRDTLARKVHSVCYPSDRSGMGYPMGYPASVEYVGSTDGLRGDAPSAHPSGFRPRCSITSTDGTSRLLMLPRGVPSSYPRGQFPEVGCEWGKPDLPHPRLW